MRQTLALVGIIRSMTIRPGSSQGGARNIRPFDVQLLVREDHPGTSSLYPIEALVHNAERPEHEAVFQARPGEAAEEGVEPRKFLKAIAALPYAQRFFLVDFAEQENARGGLMEPSPAAPSRRQRSPR